MDIPAKLGRAYRSRQVYDGLCQGADEQNIGRHAAAYVLRACGSVAHYNYPHAGCAPEAQIAAVNTWYTFQHNGDVSSDFDLPWYHQQQHVAIQGIVRIITRTKAPTRLRLQSDDLVDAVASTESTGVAAPFAGRSAFVQWRVTRYIGLATGAAKQSYESSGQRWMVGTFNLRLTSPTLPANRRITIKPQVQMVGNASTLVALGKSPSLFIESMVLRDRVDPDTHE